MEEALYQLKNHNLCQLFSRGIKQHSNGSETFHSGCVNYWQNTGNILPINQFYHCGYGWASTSECLKKCLLYDKSIIGGGDTLIWLASLSDKKNLHQILKNHPLGRLDLNGYLIDYLKLHLDRIGSKKKVKIIIIAEFSILIEISEGLKKLWFESMYLKLSNGKSRFSIICLRKKGHVCSQKPLWRAPERGFDMRISICQ